VIARATQESGKAGYQPAAGCHPAPHQDMDLVPREHARLKA
jgi:hypothetical protein